MESYNKSIKKCIYKNVPVVRYSARNTHQHTEFSLHQFHDVIRNIYVYRKLKAPFRLVTVPLLRLPASV